MGEQLGLGRSVEEVLAGMNQVAEGVKTAVVAHELAGKYGTAMPVCEDIYRDGSLGISEASWHQAAHALSCCCTRLVGWATTTA